LRPSRRAGRAGGESHILLELGDPRARLGLELARAPRALAAGVAEVREVGELGAEVLEVPTIKITRPSEVDALMDALLELNTYDWLVFTLDPSTLAIQGLVTMDPQGGESAFFFTNLKENTGLADKEFAFNIPRGVDVVTDAPR